MVLVENTAYVRKAKTTLAKFVVKVITFKKYVSASGLVK
jgi:hypothetical protein